MELTSQQRFVLGRARSFAVGALGSRVDVPIVPFSSGLRPHPIAERPTVPLGRWQSGTTIGDPDAALHINVHPDALTRFEEDPTLHSVVIHELGHGHTSAPHSVLGPRLRRALTPHVSRFRAEALKAPTLEDSQRLMQGASRIWRGGVEGVADAWAAQRGAQIFPFYPKVTEEHFAKGYLIGREIPLGG